MSIRDLSSTEQRIIADLVTRALTMGFHISVWDEECQAHPRTNDYDHIVDAIGDTDQTTLRLWLYSEERGWRKEGEILLIHGNEADVVSDYTDNTYTQQVVGD